MGVAEPASFDADDGTSRGDRHDAGRGSGAAPDRAVPARPLSPRRTRSTSSPPRRPTPPGRGGQPPWRRRAATTAGTRASSVAPASRAGTDGSGTARSGGDARTAGAGERTGRCGVSLAIATTAVDAAEPVPGFDGRAPGGRRRPGRAGTPGRHRVPRATRPSGRRPPDPAAVRTGHGRWTTANASASAGTGGWRGRPGARRHRGPRPSVPLSGPRSTGGGSGARRKPWRVADGEAPEAGGSSVTSNAPPERTAAGFRNGGRESLRPRGRAPRRPGGCPSGRG